MIPRENATMPKERRSFSSAQKADIVRRHLVGKEAVSSLADEFKIQPTLIYNWVRIVVDQAEKVFDGSRGRSPRADSASQKQVERLKEKLVQKNEVIAELMEENLKAKKANGDL